MLRNNKNKLKNSKGFTIIEVLIVLAIAGLILLIVFLAVPALQRNSRNSGRKSDIARIGGAVTEFMQNNGGRIPAPGNEQLILDGAGTLGQYELVASGPSANFSIVTRATNPAAVTSAEEIKVVTGATCKKETGGEVDDGSTRQIAILWASETTGRAISGCTEF